MLVHKTRLGYISDANYLGRKAALRQEATNELKRLKNLKRAELEAKLKAVHDIAGIAATGNRVNTGLSLKRAHPCTEHCCQLKRYRRRKYNVQHRRHR